MWKTKIPAVFWRLADPGGARGIPHTGPERYFAATGCSRVDRQTGKVAGGRVGWKIVPGPVPGEPGRGVFRKNRRTGPAKGCPN